MSDKLTEEVIVDKIINNLPEHLCVEVDKYVIMPNHIHIIFSISRADAERAIRESPLRSNNNNSTHVFCSCVL